MGAIETSRVASFILDLEYGDLPAVVQSAPRRSIVDLRAAMAVGPTTDLADIMVGLAAEEFRGSGAILAFSSLRATAPDPALLNGMILDAMDSHDGHRLAEGSRSILSKVDSSESAEEMSELVLQLAAVPSGVIEDGKTEAL